MSENTLRDIKMEAQHHDEDGEVSTIHKSKVKPPVIYKVLMHNDDFTAMEFVVHVLQKFFNKSQAQATQIMLAVHNRGVGICGVFTKEVAEMKIVKVSNYARQSGHPLKCSMEPDT